MGDRPDSALGILDAMPQPEATLLSKGQLRRWQLLRLMAQNKCDTVFRSDSLQRVLTDYYDRHGTPNERMWKRKQTEKISEYQINDRTNAIWNSPDYHHDYIFWFIDGVMRKIERPSDKKRQAPD